MKFPIKFPIRFKEAKRERNLLVPVAFILLSQMAASQEALAIRLGPQAPVEKKVESLVKDKRYKNDPTYQRMEHHERIHMENQVRARKAEEADQGKKVRASHLRAQEIEKKAAQFKAEDRHKEIEKEVHQLVNHPKYKDHQFYQNLTHEERVKVEKAVDASSERIGKGASRDELRDTALRALERGTMMKSKQKKMTGEQLNSQPQIQKSAPLTEQIR
jgi:hypothetical protein